MSTKDGSCVNDFRVVSYQPEDIEIAEKCGLRFFDGVAETINDLEVVSGRNYYQAFRAESDFYRLSLSDFFAQDPTVAEFGDLCSEAPISREMAQYIELVPPVQLVNDSPTYGLAHAGLKGATVPVHYDWDFSWVLNASLSGSKQFSLIPPENGWLISPTHNISILDISSFSEQDRKEFLRAVDGKEFDIQEGEALLFPSIWWHGAVYTETSVAISVRFGGPKHLRPLVLLPRHWLLQRIAWAEWSSKDLDVFFGWLETIYSVFFLRPELGWEERRDRMIGLYRSRLLELGHQKGSQCLMGRQYDPEPLLMREDLEQHYQQQLHLKEKADVENLRETANYIFAGKPSFDATLQESAAQFALATRQGLKPIRGLIRRGPI